MLENYHGCLTTRKKWEIARAEWQGKAGILAPAVPVVPYSFFSPGQNPN